MERSSLGQVDDVEHDIELTVLYHFDEFFPAWSGDKANTQAGQLRNPVHHVDADPLGRTILLEVERWPVGFIVDTDRLIMIGG